MRPENFLGVTHVAHDFFGRPVLAIGPAAEDGLALALDRGGKLVGGVGEALHALLARLLGVVFDRQHRLCPPRPGRFHSWGIVDLAREGINYLEGNSRTAWLLRGRGPRAQ